MILFKYPNIYYWVLRWYKMVICSHKSFSFQTSPKVHSVSKYIQHTKYKNHIYQIYNVYNIRIWLASFRNRNYSGGAETGRRRKKGICEVNFNPNVENIEVGDKVEDVESGNSWWLLILVIKVVIHINILSVYLYQNV